MILAVTGKLWIQTWCRTDIVNEQTYRDCHNLGSTEEEKQVVEKTTILANPVAKSQNFAMGTCITWSTIKKSKEAVTSELNRNSIFSETRVVKNAKESPQRILGLISDIGANPTTLMINHMHEHEINAQKMIIACTNSGDQ